MPRHLSELALRFDRSRPGPNLDTQLPAVVLWASRFPLQHGCLGVYRSLGRAGVPVYAVIGDPHAPVAKSRYVRGTLLWQPHLGEGYPELIERLIDFGRRRGRRSLIVCTSDEMAVLVARHRADLTEHFVLPDVDPELPAELADKRGLDTLGRRHGMATPAAIAADTLAQLIALDAAMTPPLIVKSVALRGQVQSVENTTLVQTREDLLAMADTWTEPFGVVLQEYLPDENCEDWFTHGYCDARSRAQVVFTGRKVRTWPARGGATAAAYTAANPTLVELARTFCAAVGYRGVFDIDWRYDRRTGRYNLLDFNPRVGAQFRIFENDAGIDVVRAMHLDLSGRPVPDGRQIDGERFIVEPWDLASLVATRRHPLDRMGGEGRPRAAWIALDDPLPVLAAAFTQIRDSIGTRVWRSRSADHCDQ
ncbi:MAG: ATP-grasp domain-containing protein [Mycobacterium sp.]|nr:MAG: ATP-grasp domain-containing protein [Mycobacterium sp.]